MGNNSVANEACVADGFDDEGRFTGMYVKQIGRQYSAEKERLRDELFEDGHENTCEIADETRPHPMTPSPHRQSAPPK